MDLIELPELEELLEKHAQLEVPDENLTQKLLDVLGLMGTCALGDVLNSQLKIERDAARKMVRKHLDDLLSDNVAKSDDAKDTLEQFYYCIDTSEILEP